MNYVQAAHAGQGCVCTPVSACIPIGGETALPFLYAGPWTRYCPLSRCFPEFCSVLGPGLRGRVGAHVRNSSSPAYLSCSRGWVQQGLPTYRTLWPGSLGRPGGGEWLGPMGRTGQSPLPPLQFPVGARRCQSGRLRSLAWVLLYFSGA